MSATAPTRTAIIARLRAAGCVFAEEEAGLLIAGAATPAELSAWVHRRTNGEPLEHLLGWAEYCGLRIRVDPGVFVPRRRTEFLVAKALASTADRRSGPLGPLVVDVCCGSGAVGAAIAACMPGIRLHAVDIDPAAVRCARRNLAVAGGTVYHGDLYEPLPAALRGLVDILVANAPYVPTGEIRLMPPEARFHESQVALDGGEDGLQVQRRVAAGSPQWLAVGGHLLIETSRRQAATTAEILASSGLHPRVVVSDELEATVVIGRRQ
jgi:release factor glutamine methyltransferase